jgi:Flp pilus assembly protein TadG
MRTRPARHRREPDAGSATVELAAAIPLLVVVTLAMVAVVGLARDQVLAQGAAREAAREAAMGGGPTRAMAAARAALPPGRASRVTVAAAGPDRVQVSVQLPVRLPFGVHPVVVTATAVAALEPGPAPPAPSALEPGPAPPAPSALEPGPGPPAPADP